MKREYMTAQMKQGLEKAHKAMFDSLPNDKVDKLVAAQAAQPVAAVVKAAESKKAEEVLTPSQAIGQFTENLDKQTSTKLKNLYDDLLAEFAAETNSKIEIGATLNSVKELLGDTFSGFLKECVESILRKSRATCYNYMALAEAFALKFAKNKVVKTALARIWSAENCFDRTNGKLKPEVDQAIAAAGGIPESTDSQTCEVWVRKFRDKVDKLVKETRSATPGGRQKEDVKAWDTETVSKKMSGLTKGFSAFIGNSGVTSELAQQLLKDILVIAGIEMSRASYANVLQEATKEIAIKTKQVKMAANSVAASQAIGPENPKQMSA
jgi:hypothetical protein